ncbi:MAG: TIM barrel protein [Candidatus Heimdallarchaeota archaeon]|nr:TIM barrel protein [Candidatus Heimdallarchaeota archaeon]
MKLLFGNRPFDFTDFFDVVQKTNFDLSKLNYIEVMKKSLEAGFKHIEITGDLIHVLPGLLTEETIDQLVAIKKEKNLSYSVHLPLWGIEPAAFSPQIRKGSVEVFEECINFTKPLDPICWVVHPTGALTVEFLHMGLPEFAQGFLVNFFQGYAEEVLKDLLDRTGISSRKLAVENIEFPFKNIASTIEELDLGICFDTGHLLAGFSGEMSVLEFVDTYYDRLVELHLHDGAYPRVDHKPLGSYDLPTRELLLDLQERKFTGPLVFELTFKGALDSMEYIRKNIPEVL